MPMELEKERVTCCGEMRVTVESLKSYQRPKALCISCCGVWSEAMVAGSVDGDEVVDGEEEEEEEEEEEGVLSSPGSVSPPSPWVSQISAW